ncbi:MAG: response regulator transcription factor [Gammaproteobacteria bacterium]|nr:response regulator transcription factor [Gammaproteobacteria bacterium]
MTDRQLLRIALLEDDDEQAARVSNWIDTKGYHCSVYSNAEDFQRAFRKSSYDVVVLDWTLQSGSSGLEVLHWIRQTLTSDIPIIFVTARQAEEDIVTALQAGADDYLAKPVRQHELLARLYALARRAQPETELLECPPYTFDTSNRQVLLDGEAIKLTEKEYELALFLFRNRGRVLSRQHLLTSVWGTSAELNTRTVDTHASRLRKKLKLLATERWKLTSIYQHGYRLEEHTSSS